MRETDEFGHDPAVQETRRLFFQMEALDSDAIAASGISRHDGKLRQAREMRLRLFSRACSEAYRKGIRLSGDRMLEVFELCQDRAFRKAGLPPSISRRSFSPDLAALVQEVQA